MTSNVFKLYQNGLKFKEEGDIKNMIVCLQHSANNGHKDAALDLASYYRTIKDHDNIVKYYKLAYENGSIDATHYLGKYFHSIGDTHNMNKYSRIATMCKS
jgi:TPR repeat protein